MTKKGFVYFFKHNLMDPVKIGCTCSDSIESRFNSFKTYSPYGAEILGFIPCVDPFKLEKKLHGKYRSKR